MAHRHAFALGTLVMAAALSTAVGDIGPRFVRVFPLAPAEGVFAYARISPDAAFLAYASESAAGPGVEPRRTIRVVHLASGKIVYSEAGIDAYWSNDGERMIYSSFAEPSAVSIRHHKTGAVTRGVAPPVLGDYYSWGVRDGRDLILTIRGNYYYLDGDRGVMPPQRVPACPDIGTGERPLLSKDGRRITTFVRGHVVVRNLADCAFVLDTGLRGAKADFSWGGRYIAFHAPKAGFDGYDLKVVDIEKRTVRTLTLAGSSLFPSWTRDGRLCFRYDGGDYRGFMIADHVLEAAERPLLDASPKLAASPRWSDLFPETPPPAQRVAVVTIWAPWSAHSPQALIDLQRASAFLQQHHQDAAVTTALDIGSQRTDVDRLRRVHGITLPEIPLTSSRFVATDAVNQIPTTLLFRDGMLIDRRLGAQDFDDLVAWVRDTLTPASVAR